MSMPDIRARMDADNMAVPKNSAAEFTDYVKTESLKYEKLVKDANIKLEQ